MPEIAVPPLFALVVFLGHYKFVSLWLRDRGGLVYFWRRGKPNFVLWVGRITFILSLMFALLTYIEQTRLFFAVGAGFIFLAHLLLLAIFMDKLP